MAGIAQGDIWWADLGPPRGGAPAFERPLAVVQCDALNRSDLSTVVCVGLTSNLARARVPGNVLLTARSTGLEQDSVADVTAVVTLDKRDLVRRAGKLPKKQLDLILAGIDIVLGR